MVEKPERKAPEPPPPVEPEEGIPAWVLTFGDMMSLLLCFFILLFAMSSVEEEKFKAASESMREAFGDNNVGLMPEDGASIVAMEPEVIREEQIDSQLEEIAKKLQDFVDENDMEDQIVVAKADNGVYLRMQDQALFSPGAADIDAASVAIVEQLGTIVEAMGLPVVVSGHTDNIPIRSPIYPSNWELSAARAAGIARALVARGHDPANVAVEAYGEHRPLTDNDTPSGRAQNRRVELYFSRIGVEESLEAQAVEAAQAEADGDSVGELNEEPNEGSSGRSQ